MFPTMGPVWKQMPISRALLGTSFGVSSKGALPPGSPLRKSLAYESPSRFPVGPLWREMPISRAFLYISFRVPSKGDLLHVPLIGLA